MLALLALLTLLAALALLALLTLLTLLALLALLGAGHLAAEFGACLFELFEGAGGAFLLFAAAVAAHGLLGFLDLAFELVESLGNDAFARGHIVAHAASNPVGAVFHAEAEFVLLGFTEGVAEAGGGGAFAGGHGAGGLAHFAFKLLVVFEHFLLLVGELSRFGFLLAGSPAGGFPGGGAGLTGLLGGSVSLLQAFFEGALALSKVLSAGGDGVHFGSGFLAPHATESALGFGEAFGGAAGAFGVAGLTSALLGAAHVIESAFDFFHGAFQTGVGGLAAGGHLTE